VVNRSRCGRQAGTARRSLNAQVTAQSRAEELRDVVNDVRGKGCVSLRQLAEHLNGLGVQTPRGGQWAAASVARLLVGTPAGSVVAQQLLFLPIELSITQDAALV
jgi:hypothetical protein